MNKTKEQKAAAAALSNKKYKLKNKAKIAAQRKEYDRLYCLRKKEERKARKAAAKAMSILEAEAKLKEQLEQEILEKKTEKAAELAKLKALKQNTILAKRRALLKATKAAQSATLAQ